MGQTALNVAPRDTWLTVKVK